MITAEENEPQPLRIIGIPKRRNGKYVLDEYAILNRECGWICPRCNEEVRITPVQAGEQTFVCKKCSASFTVHVDAEATTFMLDKKKASPTPVRSGGAPASGAAQGAVAAQSAAGVAAVQGSAGAAAAQGAAGVAVKGVAGIAAAIMAPHQASKPARGMLLIPDEADLKKPFTPKTPSCDESAETPPCDGSPTTGSLQWGGFFSRKHYQLLTGSNIIGRKDKKIPSDVEFDDPEMSRRSVRIDVVPDGQGGFSFTLTVMKALNSVTVNDRQVGLSESIELKHNDVIVMGKTSMTLKIEH
jgi:hypothetical protein